MLSGDESKAGLRGLRLLAVHRCSMGDGAGMPSLLIRFMTCSIYFKSCMSGFWIVPVGKHVSETHCWPPQSKPKISSLQPTLLPSLFFQYSASTWLTCTMETSWLPSKLNILFNKEKRGNTSLTHVMKCKRLQKNTGCRAHFIDKGWVERVKSKKLVTKFSKWKRIQLLVWKMSEGASATCRSSTPQPRLCLWFRRPLHIMWLVRFVRWPVNR